jgi:hypothetical protein
MSENYTRDFINEVKGSLNSCSSGSSDRGTIDQTARDNISDHTADSDVHVTAAEKASWNNKAELSDIPASLPANGGNADTVDGLHANEIASNPNLLINHDFRINQRGQSEYTSTGNVSIYTVDRWSLVALESATLKYNSESGVTFISNNSEGIIWSEMRQYLEKDVCARLRGKTLTLSAMIDGTLYKGTVVNYDDTSDYQPICIKAGAFEIDLRNIPTSERAAYVRIGGNGPFTVTNIEYVKLEVGSIATPFVPSSPAIELAKCQRYFQIRSAGDIPAVDLRPSMRITPTVTQLSDGNYAYSAEL